MDKEPSAEGETLEEREAAYEGFVWANLRRNYAGHFVHGMLGLTGFRLFNAPTFIPAYLQVLSGSPVLTGLGIGLQQLGGTISPIIGAAHIEHRKRVLPVSMFLGTLMRVQVLAIAIAGWLLHGKPLLFAIMAFLFLFGLFSGPQGVAFQFLLAKGIPITLRGRLQAWRNVTGGLIAAILAYLAGRYLIGGNVLGNGYSTTFLLAFVLTSFGLTAFRLLFREPIPPTVRPKMKIVDRVREFPAMLGADRGFLYFMISRTFAIAGRVSVPFFIIYAGRTIHITGANLGLLSFAYLIADTATNLIWGYMADRNGFKSAFVAALVLWISGTVLIMTVQTLPLIVAAFFLAGAANSGSPDECAKHRLRVRPSRRHGDAAGALQHGGERDVGDRPARGRPDREHARLYHGVLGRHRLGSDRTGTARVAGGGAEKAANASDCPRPRSRAGTVSRARGRGARERGRRERLSLCSLRNSGSSPDKAIGIQCGAIGESAFMALEEGAAIGDLTGGHIVIVLPDFVGGCVARIVT